MRPRVLVIAYGCLANPEGTFPGGGDIMAWNVIRRLTRTCELYVLTCDKNREVIERAIERERLPHVQFHCVGLSKWLTPLLRVFGGLHIYAYFWQWSAYYAARRLNRTIRFDLAHHLTYTNDWMASIVGALLPVPYVRGPGGGAHRVPELFLKAFSFRARLSEHLRLFGQWLFRHDPFFLLSQHRARVILACNHEAVKGVPARWRHKVQLLSVNGISAHELAPPGQDIRSETFTVLSAGRLIPLKGFDLALRAFGRFAETHPEAEFLIVGDGPELKRLENLIRELGIEKQAHIEKWMPRDRLLTLMRSCDVFIFASLRDGGGLVVIEAMAAGKPVICFNLGGPGLHVNECCGFSIAAVTPEKAAHDMALALEKLATDPELRQRLGRRAWQRAAEVYDWDHVSEHIWGVYKQVLGTAAKPSHGQAREEAVSLK
jgi:glycosyltransferase involved in cell wall biosynthesis